RCGLATLPLTAIFPSLQAFCASDRVLYKHAISSHWSNLTVAIDLVEYPATTHTETRSVCVFTRLCPRDLIHPLSSTVRNARRGARCCTPSASHAPTSPNRRSAS